jgi:Tat protein secretion system quality control protein TatD with DNase activity
VVAARVAELWDVPVDEVARVTSENACRLFRLPPL